MNMQKCTQKSLEALQSAQSLAIEHANQQLDQEHLLAALCAQQEGLIPQLLKKMDLDPEAVARAAQESIRRLPGVTGTGRDPEKIYISADLDRALNAATSINNYMPVTFQELVMNNRIFKEMNS